MLRGMFDTLDEASYVESKDAVLQLLQTRVWPLLGISQHIHNTIYAWIHFRQFAVTGESCSRFRLWQPQSPMPLAQMNLAQLGCALAHLEHTQTTTNSFDMPLALHAIHIGRTLCQGLMCFVHAQALCNVAGLCSMLHTQHASFSPRSLVVSMAASLRKQMFNVLLSCLQSSTTLHKLMSVHSPVLSCDLQVM